MHYGKCRLQGSHETALEELHQQKEKSTWTKTGIHNAYIIAGAHAAQYEKKLLLFNQFASVHDKVQQ